MENHCGLRKGADLHTQLEQLGRSDEWREREKEREREREIMKK